MADTIHGKQLVRELNNELNINLREKDVLTSYAHLSRSLKSIKRLPASERVLCHDFTYALTVILYRMYKVNTGFPTWDEETVEYLKMASEDGSPYAWYDLAQFYKYRGHINNTLSALENSLQHGMLIAFRDLEELYSKYRVFNDYYYCNVIKNILNRYYTKLEKNKFN